MEQKEKLKEITENLEKGIREFFNSDKYKDYLNTVSKFHQYSAKNTMLICSQKPDATYVAGYKAWQKDFGRHVLKGEKAIDILAPAPYKKVVETPVLGKDGKPRVDLDGSLMTKKEEVIIPSYKVVHVYDVSQTDGKELPKICKELDGSVEKYKEFQEAISRFSSVPIEPISANAKECGHYNNETKSIGIREGLSEVHEIKTSIHEVTHSILHDRDSGTAISEDPRTREVQAESVAYTVCQHYGIDTSDYSFGYIAGWSSDKDLTELKESMEVIQETSSQIIDGIDRALEEISLEKNNELTLSESMEEKMGLAVEEQSMEFERG